jgi:hypothetical protein
MANDLLPPKSLQADRSDTIQYKKVSFAVDSVAEPTSARYIKLSLLIKLNVHIEPLATTDI